jgi:hypothetical protein
MSYDEPNLERLSDIAYRRYTPPRYLLLRSCLRQGLQAYSWLPDLLTSISYCYGNGPGKRTHPLTNAETTPVEAGRRRIRIIWRPPSWVIINDCPMTTLKARWSTLWASSDGIARLVLFAFSLLAVQSLLFAAISLWHDTHKHSASKVPTGVAVAVIVIASAVLVALLVAVVLRHRWAWLVLVLLYASGLVVEAFNFNGTIEFILDIVRFGLLISPPMRRYVGGVKRTV